MAWDPIDSSELNPGFGILKHMRKVWNCLLYLFGQVGTLNGNGVPNGSFEVDSDGNGQPDNWTLATYPGGSGGVVTDVPAHGNQAIRLVHPGGAGNGGGYYESDYCVCSEFVPVFLGWIHWASAAGMHNQVRVRFFDKAKVAFAVVPLYDSVANPTAPTYFVSAFTPPASARYYKIDLIGGNADTNVAGSAWFDGIVPAGVETFVGRAAVFSMPATVGAGDDWTDCGSAQAAVPYTGMPVRLTFTATLVLQGGASISLRFRSGGNVSNELSSEAADSSVFTLVGTPDASGRVLVYMQMRGSGSAGLGTVPAGGCVARADIGSL